MQPRRNFRTPRLLLGCVISITLLLIAIPLTCSTSRAGAATKAATLRIADVPGEAPNYIFPFLTLAYASTANTLFQYMLFRPLYWFGTGSKPVLNERISLARAPVFSDGGRSATITLKTYKWSNGASVTSTDVLFWMNIWHQKPTGSVAWSRGGFSLPTDLASFKITSPTTFTMTFTRPLNRQYVLYNELSAITPIPLTWTRAKLTAAPGSSGCARAPYGTKDAACHAVYVFLSEQSGYDPTNPETTAVTNGALTRYSTNPLWSVVDGPWKLSSYKATGPAIFTRNSHYSGPNSPHYRTVTFEPFTTERAEFDALAAGTIDVGLLPASQVTDPTKAPTQASQALRRGKNNPRLSKAFQLAPVPRWGLEAVLLNFDSNGDTGAAGPILRQSYVRQAMQYSIDQRRIIDSLMKGYGVPDYGPIPVWPQNSYTSSFEKENLNSYYPSRARALLKSHGWKLVAGGPDICESPGSGRKDCGPGIKKGAHLAFTVLVTNTSTENTNIFNAEKGEWATIGIAATPRPLTVNAVLGQLAPCPKGCPWEMVFYGPGEPYKPVFYPVGQANFSPGGGFNVGDFSTNTATKMILKTITTNVDLTEYENYLAKQSPWLWEPVPVTLYEFRNGIQHPALDPLGTNTPATWRPPKS